MQQYERWFLSLGIRCTSIAGYYDDGDIVVRAHFNLS